ncbi:MAG: hypothetical protein CSA21_03330 [Deltaproteobacteria bacterium]|nr:MAG: hypothetical protein CSA21_03330 [Deltaproteobacteria bacterium]
MLKEIVAVAYDGAGNHLKTTRNGLTTYHIYDSSNNLLAEADSSGQITRCSIYAAGLEEMIEGNNAYTYHFDAIGSTMVMTDNSGAIVNQYACSPYGRDLGKTETRLQPLLYYMRAGYYDADNGRFISADPLSFEAGITYRIHCCKIDVGQLFL